MDWLANVQHIWLEALSWLARLSIIFGLLALWMPSSRGMYWWKNWRSAATDLLYWFVTPVMVAAMKLLAVLAGVTLLFGQAPGFDAIRDMDLWLQCIVVVLMQDVMLYWIHRGFHSQRGWRFHAIHHSARTVDWLSAARFHVVNYLLSFVLVDAVALLLGFSPAVLGFLAPFNVYCSAMVHANLNWTFGPLRFVFASPIFHRWHHVAEGEGMNKNFASTFPWIDLLFGTYYMPVGKIPEHFGNGEEDFPESFWGQLLYPFWRKAKPAAVAEPMVTAVRVSSTGLMTPPTEPEPRSHAPAWKREWEVI